MSRDIFISYRRDDDPGMALALHGHLVSVFSEQRIFMDVEDGIRPGQDFVTVLEQRVAECQVMLAVIGKGWLHAKDSHGRQRLNNSEDFVRIEIESAMRLGKLVIPVLVNNTEMPRAAELPDSMKPFARRQAVWITNTRLRADAESLAAKINRELSDIVARQKADEARRAPQDKSQRHEAERLPREAQEREQGAEEERKHAISGTTQHSEPRARVEINASVGMPVASERQGDAIATTPLAAGISADTELRKPQKEIRATVQGQDGALAARSTAERPSEVNKITALNAGILILAVILLSAVLALAPALVAAFLGEWLTNTATGDRWFVQVWQIAAGLFFLALCSLLLFFYIRKRLRDKSNKRTRSV